MSLPQRLDDLGLPGRRHEQWRWTDLSAIEAALGARANDSAPDPRRWLIEGVSGPVLLFVDGQCFECANETAASAETLCGEGRVRIGPGSSDAVLALVATLFNQGSLAFEAED